MFSKEEIALAKPTVDALKKIAERQEKESPSCRGKRNKPYPFDACVECDGIGKESHDWRPDECLAIDKVKGKWEWEPKVGEWCLYGNTLLLITKVTVSVLEVSGGMIEAVKADKVVPLLHWERIEEILEGMGYYFTRGEEVEQAEDVLYIKKEGLDNLRLNIEIDFRDKSRQEAVQRAVIELGKEVK